MQRIEAADWTGMRAESTQREFELFFCEHRDAAFRLALSITGDRESANDAVQEAFVKVLDRWKRVKAMDSPDGFLKQTLVRCCIDILRLRKRSVESREELTTLVSQEAIAVRQSLGKLKPDQQAILALFIGE